MGEWRYTLAEPYKFRIKEFAGILEEDFVTDWIRITPDGELIIAAGYAWNGADFWPDGPVMKNPPKGLKVVFRKIGDAIRIWTRASLGHDAIYQYLEVIASVLGMKVSEVRLIADILLAVYGRRDGAAWWRIVKWFVRRVGGGYRKLKFWIRSIRDRADED